METMRVRAKFKVERIDFSVGSRVSRDAEGNPKKDERGYDKVEPCKMATIVAHPVYHNGDPNHENTKFWQASPGGKLELNCINAAAFDQFKLGQEIYLDFSAAGAAPDIN